MEGFDDQVCNNDDKQFEKGTLPRLSDMEDGRRRIVLHGRIRGWLNDRLGGTTTANH